MSVLIPKGYFISNEYIVILINKNLCVISEKGVVAKTVGDPSYTPALTRKFPVCFFGRAFWRNLRTVGNAQ